MPRQPRNFIRGYPIHVIARGVDRQTVFFDAADYRLYLSILGEAARRHGGKIHAYVLMTNHVHLLITPECPQTLPRIFQAIGRRYVQQVNRRTQRSGTLWEGRYKACLLDSTEYLLTCSRYVELNPVRAGMVRDAAQYPYSSYRCNALGRPDPLVTPHEVYLSLGTTPSARRAAYRRLFGDVMSEEQLRAIRAATNACLVLGSERFKDEAEGRGCQARVGRKGRPPREKRVEPQFRPPPTKRLP